MTAFPSPLLHLGITGPLWFTLCFQSRGISRTPGTPEFPAPELCSSFNGSKPGSFPAIPVCVLSETPQNQQISVIHARLDKHVFSQEIYTFPKNFQLSGSGAIPGHARQVKANLSCQIQAVHLHIPSTEPSAFPATEPPRLQSSFPQPLNFKP